MPEFYVERKSRKRFRKADEMVNDFRRVGERVWKLDQTANRAGCDAKVPGSMPLTPREASGRIVRVWRRGVEFQVELKAAPARTASATRALLCRQPVVPRTSPALPSPRNSGSRILISLPNSFRAAIKAVIETFVLPASRPDGENRPLTLHTSSVKSA